jgi:hypothetical protein
MWTPPHFWALALFKLRDYDMRRRADAAECCVWVATNCLE